MSSKDAILRVAPSVLSRLSKAHVLRFQQTLGLLGPEGKAVLAAVLEALYPGQDRQGALTAFRQFRQEVGRAAEKAGVGLSLETDGQTRSHPSQRIVWFEAGDRIAEEVARMVESEIGDVDRTRAPQDVRVEKLVRFFVSYAHNAGLKDKLLEKLRPFLKTHTQFDFEIWTDSEILPGANWRSDIKKAMSNCDFGLLLVSPEFLASEFITKTELPYLIKKKRIIPVGLKPVLFDGTMNLKGLEERQIFFGSDGRAFDNCRIGKTQEDFARELFQAISRLAEQASLGPTESSGSKSLDFNSEGEDFDEPQPEAGEKLLADGASNNGPSPGAFESFGPGLDRRLQMLVEDFNPEKYVSGHGVPATFGKSLERTPEIDTRQRKDAVEFLLEWITDDRQPPYCALLGETGMGKTTTCKALARELLDRRARGEKVLLPIYFDLRHVGKSAQRDLALPEIVELILKNNWRAGPEGINLSPRELTGLVQSEGALVIWDGLDEVLVHLDTNAGQKFTRQLFRILPPAPPAGIGNAAGNLGKAEPRRGRMLITCRTHYFRTLRDQQTHFRAEDRDSVRPEHYRAPFVLLPFTPRQIRQYLKQSLPGEDPERVMGVLETVHNLSEMAERPYTLSLIAGHFAQIEQWKAEGRRVTGLMLYRDMALSWLERDQGKHQLTRDHKQALMEHIAAELWRAGERFWSVQEMEDWLVDFLTERPKMAAHYEGKDRELLKEDLRTATFLVREGEDRFRFAHTSLQEYFLAGYLRRALLEGRPEDWDLPRVSPETLDFLGQWLQDDQSEDGKGKGNDAKDGKAARAAAATLERLRDEYRARASELAFAYFLLAAEKGYPAPSPAGFQLRGANLSEWEIAGRAGQPLMLAGINLRGARLWNTRWRACNLEGAIFDSVDAVRTEWLECHLARSSWHGARLEGTVCRDCQLESANFEQAQFKRTQWLRCGLVRAVGLPAYAPSAVYAGCKDAPGRAWERERRGAPVRLRVSTGHSGVIAGCAWSPDGLYLLSASYDRTLRIWDAHSGQGLATLSGHNNAVMGCAWSPDGQRLLSASEDHTLRIWDSKSEACLATLSGHQGAVKDCAWSPDGQRLLSASEDSTLRVWDAQSGACLATLSGHQGPVSGCTWSPDGLRLLSASYDRTLRIWDVQSWDCLATLSGHHDAVTDCAWSPNGLRLLSTSDDRTLRIWDAQSGECLVTLSGHLGPVRNCVWSPDGQRLLSASDGGSLRIWDAQTGACLAILYGNYHSMYGCAWSPDGQYLLSASQDRTLRIWDAQTGACLVTLSGHQSPVWGCAWSPNGQCLLSASSDSTLRILDAQTGACLATLSGHQDSVWGCAWSPDGLRLVSSSNDLTLRVWDVQTGACVVTLSGHLNTVTSCAWSPNGLRLLSTSLGNTLRIWDAQTGACLVALSGHQGPIWGCAWSPDGLRLLSASEDRTLRIWDAQTGACLTTLSGHEDCVRSCAWSPDGLCLLSASFDRTLRIWDAQTGTCLATLFGHQDSIWGCAWSRDGHIASASADGTLRVWDACTGAQVAPEIHQFWTLRRDPSWCALDPQKQQILVCDEEAWRNLGWVTPNVNTGLPEMLPAETFGPLPITPRRETTG